jgi:hypothetical protein
VELRFLAGRAWKFANDIDTDAIIPGRYLVINEPKELAEHLFEGVRPEMAREVKLTRSPQLAAEEGGTEQTPIDTLGHRRTGEQPVPEKCVRGGGAKSRPRRLWNP